MKTALTSLYIRGLSLTIVGRRSYDGGETWLRSRAFPWWSRGAHLSRPELDDLALIQFGIDPYALYLEKCRREGSP